MPRLLALTTSQEDGGAERHLRMVLDGAAARGWELAVALPLIDATRGLHEDLRARGARVLERPLGRQGTSTAGAIAALAADAIDTARTIARVRPDAIMLGLPAPEASPGAMLACALTRVRTLVFFHLIRSDLAINARRRGLYRLLARSSEHWVCASRDNAATLARAFGVPPARIAVIHNGTPPITVDRGRRDVVRAALGLAPDATLVLTTGRLAAQKNHAVIVEALPRLVARDRGLVFAWAGDGPLRAELERMLAATGVGGHVRVLGRRDDVGDLLAAADLFLLPSRDEGAAFALLEALAAGVPAIVSDAGAQREIVRDGETGLLFATENADALVRVLGWALEHRERMAAMAVRAAELARSEYSAEAMVAALLALLAPAGGAHVRGSRRR
jgi:glycosyltransferase involved in cell wall biosynthesis